MITDKKSHHNRHAAGPQTVADPCACDQPGACPNAGWLPNYPVVNHRGERALFYDHLLLRRVVMLHFLSVQGHSAQPVCDRLVESVNLLGERLGRDVHLYSLTIEPEHDDPRTLARFAERYGAPPGWQFLTGDPHHIRTIYARFFANSHGASHTMNHHHKPGGQGDCSLGMLRYGAESIGIWGATPITARPHALIQRVDWLQPKKRTGRGGPRPSTRFSSRNFPHGGQS